MSKKILMIYPEIPATYWSMKYILKITGKKGLYPPLGAITIAGLLPDHYDTKLIDMNIAPLHEKDILDADLVFTSSMMIQKESLQEVIQLCNRLGKPVVAGGPYPTSSHHQIDGVDHFVLGEAENSLPQFLSDYEKGTLRKIYQSAEKPDMTLTPIPRFDLIDINSYATMVLQYSRGCPFNCEFCDIIEMYGRRPRTKDAEQFISEMDHLYQSGYRGPLFIVDDNFIGNKGEVNKLLPKIARWQKERNYPFLISIEASINLAYDDALMDMMKDAGFNRIFVGIETPVEESLLQAQKGQNLKIELLDSVERIQRKGMEVTAGFILGFDSDPENIFDLQIDFIRKSGIPMAMVGLLTALPSTQLYRRLEKEGRIIEESSGNNTHDFQLNFIPVMDREALVEGYKRVISQIYAPGEYFERCLTLIQRMPPSKLYKGAFSISTAIIILRVFIFSFLRQSFSSYGHLYLRYILKILVTNPQYVPKFIKMALLGHHFFKITREIVAKEDSSSSVEKIRTWLRDRAKNNATFF